MESFMRNLEKYLTEVKKGIPDTGQRLNGGADEEQLRQLAQKAGCELPAELLQLYGLSEVRTLVKLKEFMYPVKDLSIYRGHPTLEKIGLAAGVNQGFEAFEGSKVNGFTIFGNVTDEERKETKRQMERYVKTYSYGSQSM